MTMKELLLLLGTLTFDVIFSILMYLAFIIIPLWICGVFNKPVTNTPNTANRQLFNKLIKTEMKIIYNSIIPFRGFSAMAFFGVILARKSSRPLSKRTINHEAIHAAQAKECGGWILFYLKYIRFWIKYGYDNCPFEREAYEWENYDTYLSCRIKNAWKKYIEK